MRLLMIVLSILLISVLTVVVSVGVQSPVQVSPRTIPAGSAATLVTINVESFPLSGSIRVAGEEIPFRAAAKYVEALFPATLLQNKRTLSVELRRRTDANPLLVSLDIVDRKFRTTLELSANKTQVGVEEGIPVTIRISNDGPTAFYIPTYINPFLVGTVTSAFEFQVFADQIPVPFSGILAEGIGGVSRKSDTELLGANEILKLDPGYSYARSFTISVSDLTTIMRRLGRQVTPGTYRLRVRYYGFHPAVEAPLKAPFLDELTYSNEVPIEVR